MSSIALRFLGAELLADAINDALQIVERERTRGKWWVVTVVHYADDVEFGSQGRPAVPSWRVAIQSLADRYRLNKKDQEESFNALMAGGNLRKDIATKLRNRIRREIRANSYDTGNYWLSIAIGDTREEAAMASMANLLDPSTSVVVML